MTAAQASTLVKKSRSGICHDTHSSYYEKTKLYTAFDDLNACLQSGGRLPKNYVGTNVSSDSTMQQAINDADREGRQYSRIYNRRDYPHWNDTDSDCQNTRHELLIAQSQVPVTFTNSKKCTVRTGLWIGPYTGKTFFLARDVHIDHIVSLKYSFDRGSWKWSPDKKAQFANDPDNLLIVDDDTNREKSAKGPSQWMPPNQEYRCPFLKKFDSMMQKYGLSYLPNEKPEVNRLKTICGFL